MKQILVGLLILIGIGCEKHQEEVVWPDVQVKIIKVNPVDTWGGPKALTLVELPDGRRAEFGYDLGSVGEVLTLGSREVACRMIPGCSTRLPIKLYFDTNSMKSSLTNHP